MDRRSVLAAAFGLGSGGLAHAASAPLADLTVTSAIRGAINAEDFGVWPGTLDDQSRAFVRMLAKAAEQAMPVFLPAGDYVISNIRLPRSVRIEGVPGATRIVYGGNGYLFAAEDAVRVEFAGLVIAGANRSLGDAAQALIDLRRVDQLTIDGCDILGSAGTGIALESVSGAIERCSISGAADYAIYSVNARGLRITSNTVSDCADGGILVHRWQAGEDGTLVTGNRVMRCSARSGGTGQYGNGINVFRAGNVVVSGNHVSDCAFSAIRSNGGSNVQITGNQCLRSGETGLYSEFIFEGALIANNLVDGAANGISVVNFTEGGRLAVVSGNIVRNLSDEAPYEAFEAIGFGIGIAVEADTAVTGNVIEGAPRFGLMLGYGPFLRNVVANGNVIREAGEGIAVSVVEGAGAAVICDNVIEGVQRGVVGYRWGDAVSGDLAVEGTGAFGHLTVERNRVA